MTDARKLTRAQLLAAIARAEKAHFAVVDEMIDAGRGLETGNDIRRKSDALSLRWIGTIEAWSALSDERRKRIESHGSEHRAIARV